MVGAPLQVLCVAAKGGHRFFPASAPWMSVDAEPALTRDIDGTYPGSRGLSKLRHISSEAIQFNYSSAIIYTGIVDSHKQH